MPTTVNILSEKKYKDSVLFTGLPGIGLVGKITVDYLLKHLKTEKIGEVFSDSFPPSVHTKKGVLSLIKDELHAFEKEGKTFIFLSGPVQPSLDYRSGSSEEHYEFASKIVESAKSLGVKEIVTLAGINIGEKRLERDPGIIVAGTSEKVIEEWKSNGAKVDKKEGLISGAAGLILGVAKENSIAGACLMGETNASLVYGDHGSAKKLIEMLVKKFEFDINMSSIEKEAKNIEKAFAQLAQQIEALEEEEETPTKDLSYIR